MYRRSDEPRFAKKREALQNAFISLTLERGTTRLTVKEIAERANVNRMTFYSHYDEVSDILAEFIDGLTARILEPAEDDESSIPSIGQLLKRATESMNERIEFFRLVAREKGFELYHATFREAFATIFAVQLDAGTNPGPLINMVASGVTYAYLDWLVGRYENLTLEELVALCEAFATRALETQTEAHEHD